MGVIVLPGSCPRGNCPQGSCPRGIVVPGVVVLEPQSVINYGEGGGGATKRKIQNNFVCAPVKTG